MKTSHIVILMVAVLMAGCEEEPAEPNAPRITFRITPPSEQKGVLYFDAQEGKFKFEGDADLAAQKLFEMFQSEVDEYIRERCPNEPAENKL